MSVIQYTHLSSAAAPQALVLRVPRGLGEELHLLWMDLRRLGVRFGRIDGRDNHLPQRGGTLPLEKAVHRRVLIDALRNGQRCVLVQQLILFFDDTIILLFLRGASQSVSRIRTKSQRYK